MFKSLASILLFSAFTINGFTQEPQMASKEEVQFATLYMNANKERILGNNTEAANLYMKALSIDPNNAAAYFDLGKIFIENKDYPRAENVLLKASELDVSNHWYREYLGRVYSQLEKHKEAAKIYEGLLEEFPQNIDFAIRYTNAYIQMDKHKKVLKAFGKVESILGFHPELSINKYQYFVSHDKLTEAENELKKLIDFDPENTQFYSALADLYNAQGKTDEAIATYTEVNQRNPNNPLIQLSLYDFYFQKRDIEKANEYLYQAFSNPALDIDSKIAMLLKMFPTAERNPEYLAQAIELSEMVKTVHPDEAKSFAVTGDFLALKGDNPEALKNYRQAVRLDPSKFAVWSQILIIEAQLQEYDSLIVHSEQTIELFPTQPASYLFNGIANNQKGNFTTAAKTLEMGAMLTVGNNVLSSQILASLGDAYHELNRPNSSDSAYEASLYYDPDNLYVLNNYAYYLSLRGENLERAAEMSKKTVDSNPNSASYLDTYGWILYQQGKFTEAEAYLKQAIEHGGNKSGEVLEHYGDVLMKLNQKSEAITYYQQAKESGEASDDIDDKLRSAQ